MTTPAKTPRPQSGAARTAAYRERMRAAGYKATTLWLPDKRNPAFVAEARRQARAAARDPHDAETMDWLDEVRDWPRN